MNEYKEKLKQELNRFIDNLNLDYDPSPIWEASWLGYSSKWYGSTPKEVLRKVYEGCFNSEPSQDSYTLVVRRIRND